MGYNSSAKIYVTNNTKNPVKIWFSHRYSSDSVEMWPSANTKTPIINPGSNAGPLEVGFNTGTFYTGQDYWFCAIQPVKGPPSATEGSWDNPIKQCTLDGKDNGKTEYFSVTSSVFTMSELSGTCTTDMSVGNANAAIAAKQPKQVA